MFGIQIPTVLQLSYNFIFNSLSEPGYYIVLAASVPCFARRKADGATTVTEYVYHPENVHDNVLLSILQRGYEMFHFFTGGFDHLRPDDDKALFCRRVSTFTRDASVATVSSASIRRFHSRQSTRMLVSSLIEWSFFDRPLEMSFQPSGVLW